MLRSSERAVSLVVPQLKSSLIAVFRPIWFANDLQSNAAFRAAVLVSQPLAHNKLKSRSVAPLDGVCLLMDDTLENTSAVVVATEPQRFQVFCRLLIVGTVETVFEPKERPLRFAVFASSC